MKTTSEAQWKSPNWFESTSGPQVHILEFSYQVCTFLLILTAYAPLFCFNVILSGFHLVFRLFCVVVFCVIGCFYGAAPERFPLTCWQGHKGSKEISISQFTAPICWLHTLIHRMAFCIAWLCNGTYLSAWVSCSLIKLGSTGHVTQRYSPAALSISLLTVRRHCCIDMTDFVECGKLIVTLVFRIVCFFTVT